MAKQRNLTFDDGDDFPYIITLSRSGSPLDLTGYTFYFTVKKNLDDTDAEAVFKKIVTSISNPTQGVVTIDVDRADTLNQTPGEYFYDIKFQDASNKVRTVVEGKFTLTKSATQEV